MNDLDGKDRREGILKAHSQTEIPFQEGVVEKRDVLPFKQVNLEGTGKHRHRSNKMKIHTKGCQDGAENSDMRIDCKPLGADELL